MKILQIEKPQRDQYGMYIHPQCPNWDEGTTKKEHAEWLSRNGFTLQIITLENTAPQDVVDSWFENGDCDCSAWKPEPNSPDAILMSIHDTEDGPMAFYFTPVIEVEKLYVDGTDVYCYLAKGDIDESRFISHLVYTGLFEEVPRGSTILKGWYRKVPRKDECGEDGGWALHNAKANSRGAFIAIQLVLPL